MIELSMMDKITSRKQTKSVSPYAADFMSLSSILNLDEKAMLISFWRGLFLSPWHSLTIAGEPQTFIKYMVKVIEID